MKFLICLSMMVAAASVARADTVSGKRVDELVAKLPGEEIELFGFSLARESAVRDLVSLGKEAIPLLIPHLSDTRTTKSFLTLKGRRQMLQVNQIVGMVIFHLANYEFYIASGDDTLLTLRDYRPPLTDPMLIQAFQRQVHSWYSERRNWDDVTNARQNLEDGCHLNRFAAYEYFTETGNPKGHDSVVARLQTLLASPTANSTKDSEMVECAAALGSIGNKDDLPLLISLWRYLFEPKRFQEGFNTVRHLFSLANSRIKLGDRKQTIRDLDAFEEAHLSELEIRGRADFEAGREKIQ